MKEAFPIVDGCRLSAELQSLLRPSERRQDGRGHWHELPRFFYQIDSWEEARQAKLTPHFTLSELLAVDCREAGPLLRGFPHFAPCAVGVLARYLEEFRTRVGAPVFVSVNGGYRSPAHRYSSAAGPHQWATAADIYRIGDHWLDTEKSIERYAQIARSMGPEVYAKPFGHGDGETDDHLHFDLGFLRFVPRGMDEGSP
jgi:hypothetical protein